SARWSAPGWRASRKGRRSLMKFKRNAARKRRSISRPDVRGMGKKKVGRREPPFLCQSNAEPAPGSNTGCGSHAGGARCEKIATGALAHAVCETNRLTTALG